MKIEHLLLNAIFVISLLGCEKDQMAKSIDGTFTDSRDQHVYGYVKIGTQTWMAENLGYLPGSDSASVGSETEPLYYVYDYVGGSVDVAKTRPNYTMYGVLYNWVAATTACPSGWYLPTDDEWKTLELYLGMSQEDVDSYGSRDNGFLGKVLKSTSGWGGELNGNNRSGFAALPSGLRHDEGTFIWIGYYTTFWTSTEFGSSGAWGRGLYYGRDAVYRLNYNRKGGFSVRCIQR